MSIASKNYPQELRQIAASIRARANDREAIAAGFDLVAEVMEPCTDCGHPDAELEVSEAETTEAAVLHLVGSDSGV